MGGFMIAAFLPLACEAARVRAGVHFMAKQLSEGAGTPSTVAEKLVTIETDWDAQVRLSVECEAKSRGECQSPPPLFQQSCGAVATSFAQRGGDRVGVQSFMTAVCSANMLAAPSRRQCQILATALEEEMATGKAADSIDTNGLCQKFWAGLVQNVRVEEQHYQNAAVEAAAKKPAAAIIPASPQEQPQQMNKTAQRQLNVFQKVLGAGQAATVAAASQSDESAVIDAKDGDEGDESEEDAEDDQSDQDGAASDNTDEADDQAGDENDA